jgi:hypothetical protein
MVPQGPFKLVTVNTAPERAKILIGRVVELLKNDYTITEAPGSTSHPAQRATLNTNSTTKHEAIEPRTNTNNAILSSVELYRP